MSKTTNYHAAAKEHARDMVNEFLDQIIEQLIADGEASDDYNNDYPDGDAYHHQQHVDKEYSLLEAAELLDQLQEHEETDNGLWDGLEPRRAVCAQAAYTYGNAVSAEWMELIKSINADDDVQEILARSEEDDNGNPVLPTLPGWVAVELRLALEPSLPHVVGILDQPMGETDRKMLRDACKDIGRDDLAKLVTDGSKDADLRARIEAIIAD